MKVFLRLNGEEGCKMHAGSNQEGKREGVVSLQDEYWH